MWPAVFIERIRRHLQDNPSIPIQDRVWRRDFEETLESCRAHTGEGDDSELWRSRIEELDCLAQEIAHHNQNIDWQYTESILLIFENLPEIQAEIQQQFKDGCVFIGYKGVDLECASQICEKGLDIHKTVKGSVGASRGHGFYSTPHFNTALDFAKLAAISEAAKHIPELKSPIPPEDYTEVIAWKRYLRADNIFQRRKKDFEEKWEWKDYGIILRIYVKDFFSMHGLSLMDQRQTLPVDWKDFDYIEGPMQGGAGETQWEIKFNQHEAIYAKIRAFLLPRSDLSHDLPLGSIQMLKAAHEKLITFTAEIPHLGTQDEKSITSFHKRT